jgi:hypothetical protein
MELVQGLRNKKELNHLRKALYGWNAQVLYISEEISAKVFRVVFIWMRRMATRINQEFCI